MTRATAPNGQAVVDQVLERVVRIARPAIVLGEQFGPLRADEHLVRIAVRLRRRQARSACASAGR